MTNTVLVALQLIAGSLPGCTANPLTGNVRAVLAFRPAYVQVCANRCDYCKAYEAYRKELDRVGNLMVYVVPPEGKCSCRYENRLDHYDLVPVRGAE